eukprot:CAMPEP_0113649112 /NCGR_PEP_ID=MMETSP0017_2-20120614/26081_1 /TAXON_ID=2856 /ORGANISM="Cylindrotheca closterium" /LENGTH=493 /DNA_ID=CAMNT_0000561435 /DNA_START=86 /DNA_END=1567 /DNA_ORIENTATION=+ /assembly_acc=CAM_ASM_000147
MNGSSETGPLAPLRPYLESVFTVEAEKPFPNCRVGIRVTKSIKWKVFYVSSIREDSIFVNTKLKKGDVLVSINGKPCPDTLPSVLGMLGSITGQIKLTVAATKPAFDIEDNDEEKGEEKGEVSSRRLTTFEITKNKKSDKLGFTLDISRFKNPDGSNQLVVTRVQRDGSFPDLKRGSILRSVNGKPATDYKKTVKLLRASKSLNIAVEEPLRPSMMGHDQRSIMFGKREIKIETPPKGVIIIWFLIAVELLFDLVTTSFAFKAFFEESRTCCGEKIDSGSIPLATALPFAFLVIAELGFLVRAMRLTMWPPTVSEEELDPNRSCISKLFFGSNPGIVIFIINLLTVINPFFGFIIAWMLIYQSDEQEAYFVIGMESIAVILHFISVHYEGQARTFLGKIMHSLVIIPFLATGVLLSWFLQVRGICYNSEVNLFWFEGCEVCPTGVPPENSLCPIIETVNGTNITVGYEQYYLWELEQTNYCDGEFRMCFFPSD